MVRNAPNPPESRTMTSPPSAVWIRAREKVRQGAVGRQEFVSRPERAETKVRLKGGVCAIATPPPQINPEKRRTARREVFMDFLRLMADVCVGRAYPSRCH